MSTCWHHLTFQFAYTCIYRIFIKGERQKSKQSILSPYGKGILTRNVELMKETKKKLNDSKLRFWIISSVQFSQSVVSSSLRPHESQHARPPCPSAAPGVHSNSHPLSQWCHPAISSSVIPFSSCPQSLPASLSHEVAKVLEFQL